MQQEQGNEMEFLVILFDLNTMGWFNLKKDKMQPTQSDEFDETDLLEILIYQINIFLLQSSAKKAFLIIFDESTTQIIFPQLQDDLNLIQRLDFYSIKQVIYDRFLDFMSKKNPVKKSHSIFVSAYYRAICLLNKLKKTNPEAKTNARVFVVMNSDIEEKQCLNLMNCIQSAKSLNIISDSLDLTTKVQNFLTQLSQKTNGLYLPSPPKINKSLIEYFINAFIINVESRKQFKLPYPNIAHYEAVCFCHKRHINFGYICSSCLGIYCK